MILSRMDWLLLAVAAVLGWILYRLLRDGHVGVGTWEFPPRRLPGGERHGHDRGHRGSAGAAGPEPHGLRPGLPGGWNRTDWSVGGPTSPAMAMDPDRSGMGGELARDGAGGDLDRDGWRVDRDRAGPAEERDRTGSAGRGDRPDGVEEREGPERGRVLDDGLYTGLVNEMRRVTGALERQAEHLNALRVDFRDRLRAIENRLEERVRPASASASTPSPGSAGIRGPEAQATARSFGELAPAALGEPDGPPADAWLHGVETRSLEPLGTAPAAMAVPAGGRPVEVRDGVLVISHSLPPAAYAVPEGTGRARVFLNDQVEINEYALPKWEAFFEMRGARPYAMYRTLRAAEVSWDAQAERGVPGAPGIAEAV
jgi:hypothetical protein